MLADVVEGDNLMLTRLTPVTALISSVTTAGDYSLDQGC